MKTKRIIARLDVKNDTLVKGIHLEGLRVLGQPEHFAKVYHDEGIDELVYMDVVASLYNRNSLGDFIKRTADHISIPLAVGGGIRTIEDVSALLNIGADKVIINTAAVKKPSLISELANKFGSSTIVVAIEVIKEKNNTYSVYIDNGREYTGKEALSWAIQAEALGAGELLITSVDQEGTGRGVDYVLMEQISEITGVPIIAHGGIGSFEDILETTKKDSIQAVCAASVFHYELISRKDFSWGDVSGNTAFLKSGHSKKNITPISVEQCKKALKLNGILTR